MNREVCIRCCFCYVKGDMRVQKKKIEYSKKLEDLNLIDDFLFFAVLNDEVNGEEFGRNLLELIFDRDFGKLKVVPQKVYYGSDTDQHGIRLDVYLEEDINSETLLENAAIYDIESEKKRNDKDNLPRRVRFYHSKIDVGCLGTGFDYKMLKKVIVVMIVPFDPFGYDHMIYTIQNTCLEVPELPYDDGAKTLFLYTKGTKGNPTEGLKELLHYFEDTRKENAKSEKLKMIHSMVTTVKHTAGVSKGYMWMHEREQLWKEEGRAKEIISLFLEMGKTKEEIIEQLINRLQISEEGAKEYYNQLSKN